MKTERLVNPEDHCWRDGTDPVRHPIHGNGSNLFCLSFRVVLETGIMGGDQNLERKDAISIDGDGDDSHHSPKGLADMVLLINERLDSFGAANRR